MDNVFMKTKQQGNNSMFALKYIDVLMLLEACELL